MTDIVYLNGDYKRICDATLSIEDRGFIFGDGIYEVIPVICGVPIDVEPHLAKMIVSLKKINIDLKKLPTKDQMVEIIEELIKKNGPKKDHKVYIQITRGAAPRNHFFPGDIKPTVLFMLNQMTRPKTPTDGMRCILTEDIRWAYKDIKSVSLLSNVLMRQKAREKNADEAILVKKNGNVSEGAISNIFIVNNNNQIITHPADQNIIHGATRKRVINLATNNGLEVLEQEFSAKELLNAKEVFATTSGFFVRGITKVEETLINGGRVGKNTLFLEELFQKHVDAQINAKTKSHTV